MFTFALDINLYQYFAFMFRIFGILQIILLLNVCSPPNELVYPPNTPRETLTVYITKRGWHTGILVKKTALDSLIPGLTMDFPDARFLELSWGDKKFFMAERSPVGLALRAVLWPTQSVMHVYGFTFLPDDYLKNDYVKSIQLTRKGFSEMSLYMNQSFARDSSNRIIPLEKNPRGMSNYYLSNLVYGGKRTCNTWTANALKQGDFPVRPFWALTAKNLLKQIEKQKQE